MRKKHKNQSRTVYVWQSLEELKATCRKSDFPRFEHLGYVYVVEYGRKVKIGYTQDIWIRLHMLESQERNYGRNSFGRIAFTSPVEHFRTLEKHLHLKFFNKRTSQYNELFTCSFEKAIDALYTEQAEPYLIELPMTCPARVKTKPNKNPRGSAVRLRNTLAQLYRS